jgi:hypothetical protein
VGNLSEVWVLSSGKFGCDNSVAEKTAVFETIWEKIRNQMISSHRSNWSLVNSNDEPK